MRTRVIQATCAIFTFALIVSAQEQPPALKATPSTTANKSTPPLALEIFYNPTLPPAYLRIEGVDVKPHWIWVTRFLTLPGWQLPAGEQRINAVRITSQWNGETAEVQVTLLRGVNFYDKEEVVTSYQTGLDEPRVISKLESHGIQPFKITLVSPKGVAPPPPSLENRTMSVEVLKIETEGLPLPAYRVTFRNLSAKNLVALKLMDYRGGQGPGSVFFQGEDGRPLILSNGTLTKHISAYLPEKKGETYTPGAGGAHALIISTAVFTDGTFEGDLQSACMYEQFVFGRKAWLKRALQIFEEQLSQSDDSQAPQQLKQRINSLKHAGTQAERLLSSVVSSQCSRPAAFVERTFAAENLKVINDLDVIITTRPKPSIVFREWLESTRQRYRLWLNNLNEFPAPRAVTSQ